MLSFTRTLRLPVNLGSPCASGSSLRNLSFSSPVLARRTRPVIEEDFTDDDFLELLTETPEVADSPSSGHLMLREQRQILHYLRLIEHEMPKLVAYRKPFIPPTSATPLIVRSLDYQGEPHLATIKRVVVVAVDHLPLQTPQAIHKFKLLAGPRWTPNPPTDAGVAKGEPWGNGYIKISCEYLPRPEMNLKWASDTLDKLVAEANDPKDTFKTVPLDLRHVYAKARKAKKGDHLHGRVLNRPTIKDFPTEWLPGRN
ncbi:hypothetical protein K443DRAFT_91152 [Laccaria amethystina LaAM-08-1]|uniref:Small ribosomal subunit protein mS35 mitochondrial conserved domain-containing protein n=1 Tax=Laccaria amethystina LaAM-08-1 TaxID=1095629 RepID=A0A0C9YBR6_9AGAR|nr:hypothetical protein K443DRAFT_91152 [Laccaria amethystina LaAM-08-1]